MCGRFSLTATPADVEAVFEVERVPPLEPRYNIAPTQDVAVVRLDAHGKREIVMLRWGLVPHFVADPKQVRHTINARGETVALKPMFRDAHRCLVLSDGFYEWRAEGKQKTPMYMRVDNGRLFALAGLYDVWRGNDGRVIESCTIVTSAPNSVIAPIHDRMPVVLERSEYEAWLSPTTEPEVWQAMLVPKLADAMSAYSVSSYVNAPDHEGADCIRPAEPPAQGDLFGRKP